MKARWIKRGTRQRAMVRASTLEVFSAVAPALKEIGMEEVGIGGFWKHVLFWWTKKNRTAK
jgi:hypothetical protein